VTYRQFISALGSGILLFICLTGDELQAAQASDWQTLIEETRANSVSQTIRRVNLRVNAFAKISDRRNWQLADFWATPAEMLSRGGGDCEDLAIAKYYLLRAHAIPDSQLRLLFTRVLNHVNRRIEAHMVLLYQPPGAAEPLVLDNVRNDILKLSLRRDLIPTAAFDQRDYWIYNSGTWRTAKKAATISSWRNLRSRWLEQQSDGLAVATLVDR
jgi:predicted transglutaminase-like cysteine proteinase